MTDPNFSLCSSTVIKSPYLFLTNESWFRLPLRFSAYEQIINAALVYLKSKLLHLFKNNKDANTDRYNWKLDIGPESEISYQNKIQLNQATYWAYFVHVSKCWGDNFCACRPTVSGLDTPAYIQHDISWYELHRASPTCLSPTAAFKTFQ